MQICFTDPREKLPDVRKGKPWRLGKNIRESIYDVRQMLSHFQNAIR